MFQRVSVTKTLVVGSLESDTGSEFLFGYDPALGLKWLERHGKQYSALDPEWRSAEDFIRGRKPAEEPLVAVGASAPAPAPHGVPETVTRSMGQPQQVTRSAAATDGWEDPYPMDGDPRIVGDTSTSGPDIPDADISAQAEQFLMEQWEEE